MFYCIIFPLVYCCVASPIDCHIDITQAGTNVAWSTVTIQFLYLDKAGGDGTQQVVDQYVNTMADDFNVIYVHQHPRSPATNMLDLGVWMAFQNVVEKCHSIWMKEITALSRTVNMAWEDIDSVKLVNV